MRGVWRSADLRPLSVNCGSRGFENGGEEAIDVGENLFCALRLVHGFSQSCASTHAMSEPGRELLHLSGSIAKAFIDEHLEVGANHFVTIGFGRFVVTAG